MTLIAENYSFSLHQYFLQKNMNNKRVFYFGRPCGINYLLIAVSATWTSRKYFRSFILRKPHQVIFFHIYIHTEPQKLYHRKWHVWGGWLRLCSNCTFLFKRIEVMTDGQFAFWGQLCYHVIYGMILYNNYKSIKLVSNNTIGTSDT